MRVRIFKNIAGPTVEYQAGQVVPNMATSDANDLIGAKLAIAEGPDPSGTISTLYSGAGYIPLSPNPSGYIGPSGYIADIPNGQFGYYLSDDYTLTVVFPGRLETTFDILRMRPKVN